jgi:hypothetical protein
VEAYAAISKMMSRVTKIGNNPLRDRVFNFMSLHLAQDSASFRYNLHLKRSLYSISPIQNQPIVICCSSYDCADDS